MAIRADVHEAKTHFSELLDRARRGEEVIIAKAGKAYARLVPVVEAADRQAGMFRGQITGNLLGVVGPDYSAWG
jgi:prevent-host-death family protein